MRSADFTPEEFRGILGYSSILQRRPGEVPPAARKMRAPGLLAGPHRAASRWLCLSCLPPVRFSQAHRLSVCKRWEGKPSQWYGRREFCLESHGREAVQSRGVAHHSNGCERVRYGLRLDRHGTYHRNTVGQVTVGLLRR
jgi:hypothetical protein